MKIARPLIDRPGAPDIFTPPILYGWMRRIPDFNEERAARIIHPSNERCKNQWFFIVDDVSIDPPPLDDAGIARVVRPVLDKLKECWDGRIQTTQKVSVLPFGEPIDAMIQAVNRLSVAVMRARPRTVPELQCLVPVADSGLFSCLKQIARLIGVWVRDQNIAREEDVVLSVIHQRWQEFAKTLSPTDQEFVFHHSVNEHGKIAAAWLGAIIKHPALAQIFVSAVWRAGTKSRGQRSVFAVARHDTTWRGELQRLVLNHIREHGTC